MNTDEKQLLVILIGAFVVICILIVGAVLIFDVRSLVQNRLPGVQQAIGEAVDDALPDRPIGEDGEFIISEEEFELPRNVIDMGQVKRGSEVGGLIGLQRIEGWAIAGQAGETYLLDFDPMTSGFVWQMGVYRPDDKLLRMTMDSEAGYTDFTQLVVTLPVDGVYTVVLSAFGPDGKYSLRIE